MIRIGQKIEDFLFEVYQGNEIKTVRFSSYKGKWLVLLCYPFDLACMRSGELQEVIAEYYRFIDSGAAILCMNTLPIYDNRHPYGRALAIPQVAVAITSHLPGELCSYLGFESENSRLFPRGTLIIDPDGVLRARAINTGASAEPTLRSRRDAGDVIKREQRNDEEAWDCRASRMRA